MTELLHTHTRVLPCPAMGVLRTPGEGMRGWWGIFTKKKNQHKNQIYKKLFSGGFLDDERIGWPLAGTPLPCPPTDALVGASCAAQGRLPYPQIIPAPSRKHPHAPLHSAGPRMENLGLTSIPPLIFGLYYLKSCNFGVSLTFFVVGDTGCAGPKRWHIVILNTCIL